MTRMDEVVRQIEAVIDDNEYPATLDELVSMRRILMEITVHCAEKVEPCAQQHPADVAGKHRFFPGVVYDCLRDYERRRQAPGPSRPVAGVSCGTM